MTAATAQPCGHDAAIQALSGRRLHRLPTGTGLQNARGSATTHTTAGISVERLRMSSCLSPEELLRFLQGQLPADEEARAAEHFDHCADCQQLAEDGLDWEPAKHWSADAVAQLDQNFSESIPDQLLSSLTELAKSHTPVLPSDVVEIPEAIGNYRVLRLLAHGSTGNVFLATPDSSSDPDPSAWVAIKVLKPECFDRLQHRKRFERERNALVMLPPHPNVIRVIDSSLTDELRFLVMEYAGGRNLCDLPLAGGGLPVDDACRLILQAAAGLEHLHSHGLIHRDIKPSNLILNDGDTLKIVDFGIVHQAEVESFGSRLTETNSLIGTIDFMAPEQATDVRNVGPAADIYSLGCTLAWLLTGQLVFEHRTIPEALLAHRRTPVPSLRARRNDVPPRLDALFQQMIAKQPEDRPASARDVMSELQHCLAELSKGVTESPADREAVKRPNPTARTERCGRSIPLIWILIGGLLLALWGAAAAFLRR